ncbi:MAG: class IV adenylate cyclase [Candidatus Paceibacterota bacterium]|jgi:predicted adenylyl cyclase CyaB
MNIEVEIKVKINNFKEIKSKVSSIGKLVKAIKQIDDYYIPCQRDFFARKPHPIEWLRIRTNPDKIVFEYTKSVNMRENGDYDYAEEYETEISDKKEFNKILKFLDFKKVVTVEKQREYWMCGKIEVALDSIKGLGHFIEAEAKGNFKDEKEAKQECIKFLENLGIKDVKNKQIMTGYPQLLLASNKKNKTLKL